MGIGRPPWRTLAVAVASLLLAGCSSVAAPDGVRSASGPRVGTASGRAKPGPAATALAYEQALFSGRFDEAIELVIPSKRNALRVSLLDLSAESVQTTGLFVATTTTKRHVAAVTLDGVVCTTSSRLSFIGPTSHPKRGQCLESHGLRASNPLFLVRLVQTRRGRWLVRPTG